MAEPEKTVKTADEIIADSMKGPSAEAVAARAAAAAKKAEEKPEPKAKLPVAQTKKDNTPWDEKPAVKGGKAKKEKVEGEEKPKAERKPRVAKRNTDAPADDNVGAILDGVRNKAVKAAEKEFKEEMGKLKAEHKEELKKTKELTSAALAEQKAALTKGFTEKLEAAEKKAYEVGFKEGRNSVLRAIKDAK